MATSTIGRQLREQKWTKKKMKLQARQRDDVLRASWRYDIASLCAEQVVFCDESGTDRRDGARRTGWSPIGVTPTTESLFERGKRFHILPAISAFGIIDAIVYKGHTDTEGFVDWLARGLLPKMNPFPADNSVLVMDNASWHRDSRVQELCEAAGVKLMYLPPYSPDFNPIEAWFSDLKALIRRQYSTFGGDDLRDENFEAFLRQCVDQQGAKVEAIRGHYKNSHLFMRSDV